MLRGAMSRRMSAVMRSWIDGDRSRRRAAQYFDLSRSGPPRSAGLSRHFERLEPGIDVLRKRRARGLFALVHVQQHDLAGCRGVVQAAANEAAAHLDALAIGVQYRGLDDEIVSTLDLVQVPHVQFKGVERTPRAFPVRGVQPEVVHHVIDGVAYHQTIVRISYMTVVIDPFRQKLRSVWRQGRGRRYGQRRDSTQLQFFAGLRRGEHARAHGFDDGARLFHELGIAGVNTLAQVEIVLESHANVAPEQHGLRHPRHLHAADGERTPVAILGQRIDHRQQVAHVGRYSPGDAHAQLYQRRRREQPLLDHLLHEPEVARIEYFEFRLHAQVLGNGGALAQIVRSGDVGAVPVAEIQRAAIERGDVVTI